MATKPRDPRGVLNKKGGYHPACFDSHLQWNRWLMLMHTSGENARLGMCVDCTPEYKWRMMQEQRCTHPETQFIVRRNSRDPDLLELIGVSRRSVYWAKVENGSSVVDKAEHDDQQQNQG